MSNHAKEILATAKQLRELLKDNSSGIDGLIAHSKELEEELVDVYHIIELESKPNAARRMFLFSELRKILSSRREVKDDIFLSNIVNNTAKNSRGPLHGSLGELISNTNTQFKSMENRRYRPRRRFDLFDPNADYVNVTPEFQVYLDAKEAEENARLEELYAETTSEGLDEPVVVERSAEAEAIIMDIIEKHGKKAEEVMPMPIGEDKTGDEIIVEEISMQESTNLVYETSEEENEDEAESGWKNILSKLSFKKKK